MLESEPTLFELFNNALAQKLISSIERLFPGDKPCLLLLSTSFEPLVHIPVLFSALKASRVRLAFLENIRTELFKPEADNVVLLCSHQLATLKKALEILNAVNLANPGRPFRIALLVSPRRTFLTNSFLQSNPFPDLFVKVRHVADLNLDFVPIAPDAIELAAPLAESELPFDAYWGHNSLNPGLKSADFNLHLLCAEALAKLQTVFGAFEHFASKGPSADAVYQLFCYSREAKGRLLEFRESLFPHVLIIDRAVDLITPLISQWTFEGLIDESSGLSFGTVLLPKSLAKDSQKKEEERSKGSSADSEEKQRHYLIDVGDRLFERLRNLHWSQAVGALQETIKSLSQLRKQEGDILGAEQAKRALELVKMKRFLDIHVHFQTKIEAHLRKFTTLELIKFEQEILHGGGSESFERLVELLQVSLPLESAIKMLVLANFCLRGFSEDQFQRIFKEAVESYGPASLRVLLNLERAGLLVNSEDPDANRVLLKLNDLDLYKQKFMIVNERPDPGKEEDLSFAFSGYVPIVIRIVENLIAPISKGPKVKFKFGPGSAKKDFQEAKRLLVLVVGGLSCAEMSLLRRLGRLFKKQIFIVVTELTNSRTLPRAFMREMEIK